MKFLKFTMNSVKHFTSIPFYCFHYPNPQRKIPGPLQFIQSLRLRALLPFTSEFSAAVGDMQSFLASSLKKTCQTWIDSRLAGWGWGEIFVSSNTAIDTCSKIVFKRKQENKPREQERNKKEKRKSRFFTLCLRGKIGYNLISRKKIL